MNNKYYGYKIESHVVEGCISLYVVLTFNKEDEPPSLDTWPCIYVSPPNIIERLFGITFKRKLNDAKYSLSRKAERYIKKYNHAQDIAYTAMKGA